MTGGLARGRHARSGRRRITRLLGGVLLIGAGLVVFRYATELANLIGGYIAPPPQGGDVSGSGLTEGYLPFAVWGSGFTLLGIGAAMLRSAFMSSMIGPMGGAPMGGAAAMSPDAMNAYMQQALSVAKTNAPRAGTDPAAGKEVVKIKCRNCGALEAEDAAFCRKCGKPL